ncbi:MAG TPA: protein kinase [Kofleriaceae bacterium]
MVEVKTNPFAPISTEVIAPELVAAAIAAEAKAAEARATSTPTPEPLLPVDPLPPTLDEPAPAAEVPLYAAPTAPALDQSLPNEPFELEAIALDGGTLDLTAPQPEPFVPGAEEPQLPITEVPVVVFHPERLPIDIGQTDPDLPPPVALAPEQIAAAVAPEKVGPRPLQPGTLIDEYELVEWVASDAMGTLYTAHDSVEQPVAIKVIAHGVCRDEASIDKLVQSARSSRQLDSVHLVEIQGAGRLHDGRVYLVTEPVLGETLGARLARARLPIDEAMEILCQLASAVADIHRAGVTRCDLGPDSVIVRHSEEGIEVKLLQVGLAKLSRGNSPERNRGEPVGAPADIHALGLLAQHMLVGTPVDQSVIVSDARPDVPAAVDHLVDAMLASDPRRRPTAVEVQGASRKLAHSLYRGSSIELPFKLQAKLWLQKPSNRILLGVQVCLAIAGVLSYLFLRDGDSSDAKAAPKDEAAETAPAAEKDPAPEAKPAPRAETPTAAAPKKAAPAPETPKKAAPAPEAPKKAAPAPEAPKKVAPAPEAPKKAASKSTAPRTHKSAPVAAPKAPVAAPKAPVAAPRAPDAAPKAPATEPARDRDAPIKDPFGEM